ncbi:Glycerophosphoryl diester phosphodiesterase family-domain-containing protein [Xylariaceae sp. FL1019]|nr:Glycerophosphoryl diester phosphodiesterase family-domain-containing protein [Xylariaceae sp. FL1019]
MKFGLNYHRLLVPEWSQYYIAYDSLKFRFKYNPTQNETTLQILLRSIDTLDVFHGRLSNFIRQREERLRKLYFEQPEQSHICELDLYHREAESFLGELTKLRSFTRVNGEAVVKLLDRLQPSGSKESETASFIKSHWELIQKNHEAIVHDLKSKITRSHALVSQLKQSRALEPSTPDAPKNNNRTLFLDSLVKGSPKPDFLRDMPLDPTNYCLLLIAFASQMHHRDELDERTIVEACSYLLESHKTTPHHGLSIPDSEGQTPLHYLCRFSLEESGRRVLRIVLESTETTSDLDAILLLRDHINLTPLHYAIMNGDEGIVTLFIDILAASKDISSVPDYEKTIMSCLHLALSLHSAKIVTQLLRIISDPGYTFGHDKTALHIAAQSGRSENVASLLRAGANVNITDSARGWTPIFYAAIHGNTDCATLLIDAGISTDLMDRAGWTAREHATYRGHLAVAEILPCPKAHEDNIDNHIRYSSKARQTEGSNKPITTMTLVVHLGSMQVGRNTPPLKFKHISSEPLGHGLNREDDVTLLTVTGGSQSYRIRLPILDEPTAPLVFHFQENSELDLIFKIFQFDASTTEKLVYGGTAILESNRLLFGSNRQSLIREHTVPILNNTTLERTGSLLFTYVIVKPIPPLDLPGYNLKKDQNDRMTLIGHRGLGQNVSSREHLQIGENTIESFLAAAAAGASFVEFDVQVTRDLEPVIYHDFSLSESGTDIPIYDMTVDQYRYANSFQGPSEPSRLRSRSLELVDETSTLRLRDRLENTVNFKAKGLIANTRGGDFIHHPFATLKELFTKLPENIGFNIEMKYQRLHEAVAAGVAPVAIELNVFVDTVLEMVRHFAGDRPIVFSSFTPEVCILLSLKQKVYPVMFLTNAGKMPMIDMEKRAASLQVAVKFARFWGLTGLVLHSEAFLLCPRLIGLVKSAGLVCASYGLRNNVPEDVKTQADAGLDVIIVDKVRLVAKTLSGSAQ